MAPINIVMGNLYNVEQKVNPVEVARTDAGSQSGLGTWKQEVRKQIMEKLRGYSPEHVDSIIRATFGNLYDS